MNWFHRIVAASLFAAILGIVDAPARAQAADEDTPQKFGDWTLTCRPTPPGAPRFCALRQDIIWRQTGKRVISIALVRPSPRQPFVVSITAPLGILLPAGLTLIVDNEELVRFPLRICNINGCQGTFPLSVGVRDKFAASAIGEVMFRQPNGRPLRVQFSLKGFKDAYAALAGN